MLLTSQMLFFHSSYIYIYIYKSEYIFVFPRCRDLEEGGLGLLAGVGVQVGKNVHELVQCPTKNTTTCTKLLLQASVTESLIKLCHNIFPEVEERERTVILICFWLVLKLEIAGSHDLASFKIFSQTFSPREGFKSGE